MSKAAKPRKPKVMQSNYNVAAETTGSTYKGSHSNEWDGEFAYSACKHWRTPVKVGNTSGKLVASGHTNSPKPPALTWQPYPSLGVYLSRFWLEDLGRVVAQGVRIKGGAPWPYLYTDWPDMSPVEQEPLAVIVDAVIAALGKGQTVEIGCTGGHGRTGTVIAGVLAILEGLDAGTAIAETRKRYCVSAIETFKQEEMIYHLLGETPPKPKYAESWKPADVKYCDCGHSDFWHGQPAPSKDYKTGPCYAKATDNQPCPCGVFATQIALPPAPTKTAGASKPCVCGHAKSRHRGVGKTCNLCGCGHYAKRQKPGLPPADLRPNPAVAPMTGGRHCVCGHLEPTHLGSGECVLCICDSYIDASGVPGAEDLAYSFPRREVSWPASLSELDR